MDLNDFTFKKNIPKEPKLKKLVEDLCEVYILYFDESQGHVPLLICPDESIKKDGKKMRLINIHSIWFMDIEEHPELDRVDMEYGGKMYFAKKFFVPSKREKRRAGLNIDTMETIVIIVVIPADLDIFGGSLVKIMAKFIIRDFRDELYFIIESEIAKLEIIKTANIKEIIERGELIKIKLRNLIKETCQEYFSSAIKLSDATSIKLQKAISFLLLKGTDVNHIISNNQEKEFSNIRLFSIKKESDEKLKRKLQFKISELRFARDSEEIEILVKNNAYTKARNVRAKITSIKNFFEREILNENIDSWEPKEELLFITPIYPGANEYIFTISQENLTQTLLSKKFNLENEKLL